MGTRSSEKETCYVREHVIVRLELKYIVAGARHPFRKRETDAGYDLHALEDCLLPVGKSTLVRTGIAIACPPGFYYTIEGRSSLWMQGIFPNRGIIDSSYTGEVVVSLVNVSDNPYQITQGDRIAQFLLHKQYDAEFIEVDNFSPIYEQRGQNGFGSSGK